MSILIDFGNNSRFFDCFKYELRETKLELFNKDGSSIISFDRFDIKQYLVVLK